jgi:hypothetical protein
MRRAPVSRAPRCRRRSAGVGALCARTASNRFLSALTCPRMSRLRDSRGVPATRRTNPPGWKPNGPPSARGQEVTEWGLVRSIAQIARSDTETQGRSENKELYMPNGGGACPRHGCGQIGEAWLGAAGPRTRRSDRYRAGPLSHVVLIGEHDGWIRSRAPGLVMTRETCVLTVASPTKSPAAITVFVRPLAISCHTSVSRGVRVRQRASVGRPARIGLDQPPGDRGGQQRVAAHAFADPRDHPAS